MILSKPVVHTTYVDKVIGFSHCQKKEELGNTIPNPYWPKALVTPFMVNRGLELKTLHTKKNTSK